MFGSIWRLIKWQQIHKIINATGQKSSVDFEDVYDIARFVYIAMPVCHVKEPCNISGN